MVDESRDQQASQNRSTPARSSKKKIATIAAAVLMIVALTGAAYVLKVNGDIAREEERAASDKAPDAPIATEELQDNPIDFASLKAENQDIYAWITIPNTNVNSPILQSTDDDLFYLTHDRDKNDSAAGSLFTQSMNKTDFFDPVTVVYGHVLGSDILFHDLHKFEDADFFANNSTMYIYTPGHILIYEIVAAYEYDNRHIMNSFDFSDQSTLQGYFDSVLNPASLNRHVRDDVTLSASSDKIVQLSTCMLTGDTESVRYIVTGVLRDDQPTR